MPSHLHLHRAPTKGKGKDGSSSSSSSFSTMPSIKDMKHKVTRKKIPILGKIMDLFHDLNPVFKSMVIFTVVLWKLYIAYYLFYGLGAFGHDGNVGPVPVPVPPFNLGVNGNAGNTLLVPPVAVEANHISQIMTMEQDSDNNSNTDAVSNPDKAKPITIGMVPLHTPEKPLKVLHIVTALAEYNNGSRGTERGEDRLQNVFIPVLKNSIESMVSPPYNYQVDVFLVLGWELKPERRKLIEDALPDGVGLQVWNDATPLGYDRPKTDVKLKLVTRGLARQHRYVVKDKLMHYDLFSVFEDDMRITGGHIHHYLEMSRELERLAEEAPETLPDEADYPKDSGSVSRKLSKKQLKRMMPGFIRGEVLLDESKYPSQRDLDPIPTDFMYEMEDGTFEEKMFDASKAFHVPPNLGKMPPTPRGDQVMIWETAVKGTVVRRIPEGGTNFLDWIMLQPGPKNVGKDEYIGGYWSGNLGVYGDEQKPGAGDPRLIAQQGGWMATREQLIEMHTHQCKAGFFSPYENKLFNQDGLTLNNVEFWSGGFSIFSGTRAGCNMQRAISVKPEHFSQHFLYHTANNKQKSLPNFRLLKANNFMGQINSVVKGAKKVLAAATK